MDTEDWDILPGPSLEYWGRCGCWEGFVEGGPGRVVQLDSGRMFKDLAR